MADIPQLGQIPLFMNQLRIRYWGLLVVQLVYLNVSTACRIWDNLISCEAEHSQEYSLEYLGMHIPTDDSRTNQSQVKVLRC